MSDHYERVESGLHHLRLQPYSRSKSSSTRSQQTTGSASLHLKLGIAHLNVIDVLLYAEYGAMLQIDQYNNTMTM